MELDPGTLDLNAILREALHHRGTAQEVRPHLQAAVAAAVADPAAAAAITAGIWRTVERAAGDLGGDTGDALHSLVVNLGRAHFNIDWAGGTPGDELTDESYVVAGGKLQRLGALDPAARDEVRRRLAGPDAAPSTAAPLPAAAGGRGCLLLLAAVCAVALALAA